MKNHSTLVVTSLAAGTLAGIVNDYFRQAKASVEAIEDNRNALERAQGGREPVIAVVGIAQGMFKRWGVQVYVYEGDERNGVELVAVGDGAMGQMWHGSRNTLSFSQSVTARDELVRMLVSRDPSAEVDRE